MEALRYPDDGDQKPIEEMSFSELNACGWNAYLEQDEETLSELAAEAEARKIIQEASAKSTTLERESYSVLSRSLYRSLNNLREYKERQKHG